MTTFDSLLATGSIVRVEIPLDTRSQTHRLLYATPAFVDWLSELSRSDHPSPLRADMTPAEQVDFLFFTYVTGQPLTYSRQFRAIRPEPNAIWELKTIDLRIFGWFLRKDCFVCAFGDWADHVKDHDLYRGYRLEIRRLRRELGIGKELCVEGIDPNDVLSS